MYGWRARLGVIIPSLNVVTEPEFSLMAPKGVTCHYQRFSFTGGGIEVLKELGKLVPDAAEEISHVRPSAVAMCCTAGSFAGGRGYDEMLIQKMKERNGNLPTTTASTSVLDAFNKLGIKKISMAVPYLEEIAKTERKFCEDNGIEVLSLKWLNKDGFEMNEIPYEMVYNLAREANEPESEAIFISCVALHTIEIIDQIEQDMKKPVITSNQATMWNLLRLANIHEKIEGYGKLLLNT